MLLLAALHHQEIHLIIQKNNLNVALNIFFVDENGVEYVKIWR